MSYTVKFNDHEDYVEDEVLNKIITPEYQDNPFEVLGENDFRKPTEREPSTPDTAGTPVQEFFRDAVILVTGGTGFVGQVLLEKLLRSCPNIARIYLLIREKEHCSPQQVLESVFENRLFKRLKFEVPDCMNKLSVLVGDINKPRLGLSSSEEVQLQQTITIVYHCAANVRFTTSLLEAVTTNSRGTNEIIHFVKSFRSLKAFMYLSTAYSFCPNSVIDETVPAASLESLQYNSILTKLETTDATSEKKEAQKIMSPWPNTYVFSKALTESLIVNEGNDLPVGIFRPSVSKWKSQYLLNLGNSTYCCRTASQSIFSVLSKKRFLVVISTYREPIRGWNNSFQGFLNGCLGIALGVVHVCYIPKQMKALDMVPVDLVANALICAAKDVHDDFLASKCVELSINWVAPLAVVVSHHTYDDLMHSGTQNFSPPNQAKREIPIYNYVNGGQSAITWEEFVLYSYPHMEQWSTMKSMWYPSVILTYNRFVFVLLWLSLHIVAGFLLDVVYVLVGRKPTYLSPSHLLVNIITEGALTSSYTIYYRLTKTYKRYFRLYKKVGYFSSREWSFQNERVRVLWNQLSSEDRRLFFFDMKQIDWKTYLGSLVLGGRTFVLKEPISSLPAARKRMKRLRYLHLATKYCFILSVIMTFSLVFYSYYF